MRRHKLGIIGGAGPHAGGLLFKETLQVFSASGEPVPEIIFLSYPFTRGLQYEDAAKYLNLLMKQLQYCIDKLADQSVTLAALGCNTLHIFLETLDTRGIEFISLPKSVVDTALKQKMKRLLILATETSIRNGLYSHPKLDMITPCQNQQTVIDTILNSIQDNRFDSHDGETLREIIEKIYNHFPFDGVVLGCTDFAVLHAAFPLHHPDLPTLDSVKIAAQKLVKTYLGGSHV